MRTGTIKFNVTERGRKFRGADRNFDTVALAAVVNGGEVQERVRNRDLRGYFGHWPRSMFGMDPPEGGIHDGKQVRRRSSPRRPTAPSSTRPSSWTRHLVARPNASSPARPAASAPSSPCASRAGATCPSPSTASTT